METAPTDREIWLACKTMQEGATITLAGRWRNKFNEWTVWDDTVVEPVAWQLIHKPAPPAKTSGAAEDVKTGGAS